MNSSTVSKESVGWTSFALGTLWKTAEVAHNLEYIRSMLLEHDVVAFVMFVLRPPAVLFIGLGVVCVLIGMARRPKLMMKARPAENVLDSTAAVPRDGSLRLSASYDIEIHEELVERFVRRTIVIRRHPP